MMDPQIWTRAARDLHPPRRSTVIIEHILLVAIGIAIGFLAGLVVAG